MKKKRSQLLKDLVGSNPDIESIFFRLKVIASELPDSERTTQIREWIDSEISGYPDISAIPEYRIKQGSPEGTYISNFRHQITGIVPIRASNAPIEDIKDWEVLYINNPITDIQNMVKQDKSIGKIIPTELLHYYSMPKFQMLSVSMKLSVNELSAIESTVKSKLVDIILELEKELPDIDSLDIPENISKDPEIIHGLTTSIINIITDNSVEIGDSNEIKKSDIGTFKD